MNMRPLLGLVVVIVLFAVLSVSVQAQGPVDTAFTYQGQLKASGAAVNATCDMQFSLWDAAGTGTPPSGGTQIGATQTNTNVSVVGGLFTARLDFSSSFPGAARWLGIGVRCPAG